MKETALAERARALERRYGGKAPPLEGPWNGVLDQLLAHRSVRKYSDAPLPANTLEILVAAAQSAATSHNFQSWSVVAVADQQRKDRLSALANRQEHVSRCPLFLVWVADLSRLSGVVGDDDAEPTALHFFETFLTAAIDGAVAAQTAVVAAESLGLFTVYVGALRNRSEEVASELGLPPGTAPLFGLCVGYEAQPGTSEVKPRMPQEVVLHRERYDAMPWKAHGTTYDQTVRDFSQRAGISGESWSERVMRRLKKSSSLDGRDGLKATLRKMGIPLR